MRILKQTIAYLLLAILITPTSSLSALTVQQAVNSLQAMDPALPSGVANPKGSIGYILSSIFGTVGKIQAQYIDYSGISAWTQSGASIYLTTTTGSVGIGTISPSYKLDVNGTVNATAFRGDGSALTGITPSQIGLGSVNNTSDVSKPVSTATQTALNLKADLASPSLTGTPTAPTPLTTDNSTTLATTAFVKGQNYITSAGFPVQSVSGRTGVVTLSQADIGGLTIASSPTFNQVITSNNGNGTNYRVGDDSWLGDINVANTAGIYGVQDSTVGSIKLGSNGGTVSGYNGNVGIGTTSPGNLLSLSKATATATFNDALSINNPTNSSGIGSSILMNAISTNGVRLYTSIGNAVVGAEATDFVIQNYRAGAWIDRFKIDYNGNVGIGTTTPGSPLQITSTTNDAAFITIGHSNWPTKAYAGMGGLVTDGGGNTAGRLKFYTRRLSTDASMTEGMVLDENGRVGIGTTSPNSLLDVNGGSHFYGIANFDGATYAAQDFKVAGVHKGYLASSNAVISGGSVSDFVLDASVGKLQLATGDVARMTIDTTGNVGIGTTTPGTKLDVESSAGGPMSPTVIVGGNGANAAITVNSAGTSNYAYQTFAQGSVGKWEMGATGDGNSNFYLNPNVQQGYNSAAFFIQRNGNVGIGNTGPSYKLDVTGDIRATGNVYGANKYFNIQDPRYNDPNKRLIHSVLEGPEIAVFYRGEGKLVNGEAKVTLPSYFEALTREEGRTVILTPTFEKRGDKLCNLAPGPVKNAEFDIIAYGDQDVTICNEKFYWEVKAVRADNAPLVAESEMKDGKEYGMDGKLVDRTSKLAKDFTSKTKVETPVIKPIVDTTTSGSLSVAESTGNTAPIMHKNTVASSEANPVSSVVRAPVAPTSQSHILSWVIGVVILLIGATSFVLVRRRK